MPAQLFRLVAASAVLVLLSAGCGDDNETTSTSTPSSTTTTVTPSPTTTATTPPLEPTPTTPMPESDLPGEAFSRTPVPGSTLAVVGVAFDDVLNVRRGPGIDHDIVEDLDPTATDVEAVGRARLLTDSIWWEVRTTDGVVGWVNSRYTAVIGPTDDVTSRVTSALGETPSGRTMEELGEIVADVLSGDPDVPSTVTLTVPATAGDLGEITYDLLGLGDDAVSGLRLHVFGTPGEPNEFTLKSVESTDLCDSTRGVDEPSGLCA